MLVAKIERAIYQNPVSAQVYMVQYCPFCLFNITEKTLNTQQNQKILTVALPVPMRQSFDYLIKTQGDINHLIGCRVCVPFGRRKLIGLIINTKNTSDYAQEKLKEINYLIDEHHILPKELLSLLSWAANYYNHPIGDVIFASLPPALRGERPQPTISTYTLTQEGKGLPKTALQKSPKQQFVLQHLLTHGTLYKTELKELLINNATIKSLTNKNIIQSHQQPLTLLESTDRRKVFSETILLESPKELNKEQLLAIQEIHPSTFKTYLLEGVTGSGKTEVYLQAIGRTLNAGQQALVLIPEIGLSPQTFERFRQRFNVKIAELHSNISELQRVNNWQAAGNGSARIIIGTRLAALCPTQNLGIIIIDEEHDLSYKQQDGFRYSARDICIYRAKTKDIPIILGSATPSLESLHNAQQNRYKLLQLTQRAGNAAKPTIQIQDIRKQKLFGGVSQSSIEIIRNTIEKGQQALIFINARGYAAISLCHACGWIAECKHCDHKLTLHMSPYELHCHQCDHRYQVPKQCPNCDSKELHNSGFGTEQTEHQLKHIFTHNDVIRIDRDSTQRKYSFEEHIETIKTGKPCILVGTQMLAKGHHLPNLGLVVILDTDRGLFSSDFRAAERMGQLITQVAGRAGREDVPGKVIIQTHNPIHPLLELLIQKGYSNYAKQLLHERAACGLPPYAYMTIFRTESPVASKAKDLLLHIRQLCTVNQPLLPKHQILGPIPAPIERIKNSFRFQLQITTTERTAMQNIVKFLVSETENHPLAKQARWSLDIDAVDSN